MKLASLSTVGESRQVTRNGLGRVLVNWGTGPLSLSLIGVRLTFKSPMQDGVS